MARLSQRHGTLSVSQTHGAAVARRAYRSRNLGISSAKLQGLWRMSS